MSLSYSFHLSNKQHAITTASKLNGVSKHNLRAYKQRADDKSFIEVLSGSRLSISEDVKRIYHEEFDQAVADYNAKQKRSDRQISDYLKHVSDSRADIAAEIIIQVGDMNFWKDKPIEQKKKMSYIFRDQLRYLQQLLPDFKIASAVIHYEEQGESPHMHIVGVPVASGYTKGMEKQVAKTKVFTRESLTQLQDLMRQRVERGIEMNPDVFNTEKLKEKEQGRNKDIPKKSLNEFYALQKSLSELHISILNEENRLNEVQNVLKQKNAEIDDLRSLKSVLNAKVTRLQKNLVGLAADIKNLPAFIQEYQNKLCKPTLETLSTLNSSQDSFTGNVSSSQNSSFANRCIENFIEKKEQQDKPKEKPKKAKHRMLEDDYEL